jgi:anionic cell wall polymer biosynthesis LytR-Cps2A-Psr (LCP) family protein
VRDLTGVAADHYAIVDMSAVGALTAAVGGVPVCLNAVTSDPLSGVVFPAGEQVLDGPAALAFLRQRHGLPNGDLDRMTRLQAFLHSLSTSLEGADLGAVVAAIHDHVHTDTALDLLGLAQDLAGATSVRSGTIPYSDANIETPDNGSAIGVDPAQVKEFVEALPDTPPPGDGVTCVN